jgi:hypothetical protein
MRTVLARTALAASLLLLLGGAALAPSAKASPAPAWSVSATPVPSNVLPGGTGQLLVRATNVGGAPTTGATTVEATLPPSLTPTSARLDPSGPSRLAVSCTVSAPTVSCETPTAVPPSVVIWMTVEFQVALSPPPNVLVQASIGSEETAEASATTNVAVQSEAVPFGFLNPLEAPFTDEGGSVATLAASHPYQQTVSFDLPTQLLGNPTKIPYGSGYAKDIQLDLPAGLIGDPSATPVLCTEAELEGSGCPDASAIGILGTPVFLGAFGFSSTALFNMVPSPGHPAAFASNIAGAGLFVHLLPSVRSEGDYGISVDVPDILALSSHPLFDSTSQIWGDPSSSVHDHARGLCAENGFSESCPVEPQPSAFWTLPSSCDGQPLRTEISADSWEEPGVFHHSSYASADLGGNPVSVSGCNQLSFAPTISVQPTTNLTDSPSGLDVDLHQPQDMDEESRSTPPLRDATVTLPAGMVVNPSQASGREACDTQQIGLLTEVGATPIHFDNAPNSCPDASKLGSVEVTTPLLAERDEQHRLEIDPETGDPMLAPLHGSVYLAKPFDNPFKSLLAIYLVVEDPPTGTVAKLAGRIEADPNSGRLTTVFGENPQLPLEDIRLHLFGGARASLITPPVCGTHATVTDLVPWSAPETADAHPSDSFQSTAAPGGGACPTSEAALPSAPSFVAGTIGRQAGSYSPFSLKISREDGSARLGKIETLLPRGLAARFAGVAECSDAQIAAAQAREHPEEGILERQSPSCPAASRLGTVTVAAGAGPSPFYTRGTAYLAGPYKGAPLSLGIITPAIAGPFDLGNVVVRTALYVDPVTAQGRAVSDPLPTIIDGIPLDVRSVAIELDRPDFTLNPTSCDPMAITGSATTALGAGAALSTPFQVGGCSSLAFKPKLAIKLKGGTGRSKNPALRATLTMPPGGANIARASVALPHTEFLDQAHIRTICTRVQFAAAGGNGGGCPPGSIYGKARAFTPLLDASLEGPVYLRSSDHLLPDLVAALHGQIDVDLVGRIDSHKGGIRTTFEGVPDAPVSKFVLEMQGGKKGLLENSTNLCRTTNRGTALFDGQNGKTHDFNPVARSDCKGAR